MSRTSIPMQRVRVLCSRFLLLFLIWPGFATYTLRCQEKPPVGSALSSAQLIAELSCQSGLDQGTRVKVRDELARRRTAHLLIGSYPTADDCRRLWIVQALYSIRPPREVSVDKFMRSLAGSKTDQETWFALEYLAEKGDTKAMAQLAQNCYKYEIPSLAWGQTLLLFGKYKYYPAVPCLIDSISSVAGEDDLSALHMLFPGSPSEFRTDQEAREYFQAREKNENPSGTPR